MAGVDGSTGDTRVSSSSFFPPGREERKGPWTYSEEVRDPGKLEESGKLPFSHVAFNLLCLLNNHILPSLWDLGEAISYFDCIDRRKSEFALKILERKTN
jgi:hypothetical protein